VCLVDVSYWKIPTGFSMTVINIRKIEYMKYVRSNDKQTLDLPLPEMWTVCKCRLSNLVKTMCNKS
jgi:hypothetical protein